MENLQVFNNDTFGQVRTINRDGAPWFVAVDVCRALEVGETHVALRRLDDDEKGRYSIPTPGGEQKMSVINEPGLYTLVLGSRKKEARAFKRWITHEVIPAIRKHGAYATNETIDKLLSNPDFGIRLLTELKEERFHRQLLQKRAKEDAPKVLFADSVATSSKSILVCELAKLLKQNGVNIGQNRLFALLRKEGYLCSAPGERWNTPTQRAMELELFEVKEWLWRFADGTVDLRSTTRVTGKGQIYFINRYTKKGIA